MTEERQPDEVLVERVRELLGSIHGVIMKPDSRRSAVAKITAFAQSILAEARQHCAHCVCECPECKSHD